ncbi:MAG TPA: phage portal protein [Roseococcus sp.]|jgi:HK97 family phage portal protein|nr:phage portal protein [Roseococcus sp.]
MALMERLMAAVGYEPMRRTDAHAGWLPQGDVSQSGVSVTASAALQYGVVQAVLEVLGATVSTLPFMVYRRTPDAREPVRDHPVSVILNDRPGPRVTAQEFWDEQTRHLAFERNCYARILSEGGAPISGLDIIHPTRVTKIERGPDGRVYYTINPLSTGTVETLRDDEIWHVRKAPLTADGLRGIPVWQTGREEIGRALAVEHYGARYFRNSGKGGGTIKHPGNFRSREDREEFLENWRRSTTGDNQHRDRLLTHGADYVPNNVANDEAQFIDTLKQLEVKVARLWQMPPHRVGILDRATHSNIEHQGIDYVVHTLAPWIAAFEQAAGRDLLVGEERASLFCEFNVAGLLRGDLLARYRAYSMGRQWGWLSVNDIRRLENRPGIGLQGDRYLEPENMRRAGNRDEPGNDDEPARRPGE